MSEFDKWLDEAQKNGWRVPQNMNFSAESWVNYWKQCAEYERNPDAGRPVVPHRSA